MFVAALFLLPPLTAFSSLKENFSIPAIQKTNERSIFFLATALKNGIV